MVGRGPRRPCTTARAALAATTTRFGSTLAQPANMPFGCEARGARLVRTVVVPRLRG